MVEMEYVFDDVLVIKNGKNQKAVENPEGQYPIYGSGGIMGYADNYTCEADTVIIGRKGSINNPIYVSEPFWNVDTAFGLSAKRELLLPKYLFYFCKKFDFEKLNKTVTIPSLTKSDLLKIKINLPNISVQQEVIDKLSKIESVIDLRKQELSTLDSLMKARFVELMNWYPSNNYLKEFISSYKAERCGERDLPVLSITKEDGIVFQSEKFKKRIASVDASTYKVVPKGKLVQGIHIDERNFAIQNIADEGIVSPAYKIWNVDESKAIPEVLAFAMRTDKTMSYISSKFTGSVKRRESISMEDFMVTPIDLPEMNVQIEFYEFMMQVDKSKAAVQAALDKAQLLFDSLMQEYFG